MIVKFSLIQVFQGGKDQIWAIRLLLGNCFIVSSQGIDGSVLIVESLDRFSRENPFRVAGYIAKLAEHSIDIIDVEQNLVIGTSNPWSSTIASIIANRAHEESTLKSKRIKAAWNSRRRKAEESGQYMIKNTPFWIDVLDDKYVANADASIVREILICTCKDTARLP